MPKSPKLNLPDDLEQCQKMILHMQEQMESLQEQVQLLLRARYGRKSETIPAGQLRLFGEQTAELEADDARQTGEVELARKAHGRKKPSKDLPRVRREYDVIESARPCPDCCTVREIIGEEVSEQYDYTPASIRVIEHVRLKRSCKKCGEHVIVAEKPKEVIEKGLAAASMLAYVATSKLADHLPLNRLEGIFKRDGAIISRSTMCDWMAKTADCLKPLYAEMKKRILLSNVIWTDDTPVKMQDRSDERNMRNARVWVYIGDKTNPYTVFDFTESRKRDGPLRFLDHFEGYLQADAFSGYDCIFAGGKVHEVACWAHTRRKFYEAQPTNSIACREILGLIGQLYEIERKVVEYSSELRAKKREAEAAPILARIKEFLEKQKLMVLPRSALGKAVTYALNNWAALNTYTSNGALSIDNNQAERALRSMAIGRKNWLFMGSTRGGMTNSIIASVIATCKAHDVHPRLYLEDVLTRLARGETDFASLMPDRCQSQIN